MIVIEQARLLKALAQLTIELHLCFSFFIDALTRERKVNELIYMATKCQEPIRNSPDFIEKLTRLLGDVLSADW